MRPAWQGPKRAPTNLRARRARGRAFTRAPGGRDILSGGRSQRGHGPRISAEVSPATSPPTDETCAGGALLPQNRTIDVALGSHADDIDLRCAVSGSLDAAYRLDLPSASDVLLVERISKGDTAAVELSLPACASVSDRLSCVTGSNSPSVIHTGVAAGSYRAIVESTAGAPVSLTAFVRPAAAPSLVLFADACAAAFPIGETGGLFQGNTANATADFPAGCDFNAGPIAGAPDQILKLVLPAQKRVVLDMSGSDYTTLLDLRRGDTCPGTEVVDGCSVGPTSGRSFVDQVLSAGTYWIQVDGYAGDSGAWLLDVRVVDP